MYEKIFIDSLPEEPVFAIKTICDKFFEFRTKNTNKPANPPNVRYEEHLQALAFLQAFAKSHGLGFSYPTLEKNNDINITKIVDFFVNVANEYKIQSDKITLERYKKIFTERIGKVFLYEFSDGDMKRIQTLINELRSLISNTKELENNHKSRLLWRLEKLQSELHKKISDIDRFWGLVGEGGVVLAKLGENAKPIVDRIREIAEIVWRLQTRAEELPSNIPLQLLGQEEHKEVK